MIRRLIAFLLIVVALLASCAINPASATVTPAVKHQVIASVLFRQNSGEAQVALSTVDAGPMHHINRGAFRRGIILADDAGRLIALRGEATIEYQDRHSQMFHFDNVQIDMPGRRVVRITHFSFAVVTGDFRHPNFICGSPSLSIDACLTYWKTD